jgi:hypothetical protein
VARPSKYSIAIAADICGRLAGGESLAAICRADEKLPDIRTIYRWLADEKNDGFRQLYAQAREDQADTLADEILAIADEKPVMPAPEGVAGAPVALDSAAVAHQRLRIDARKWIASKLKPRKYGDKVELGGPDGGPIILKLSDADARA